MELTLFVDHQCNLRCTYCYNGEKFSRPMSVETMRKAVALALKMPLPRFHVSFFGGEPLLHRELLRQTVAHVETELAKLESPPEDQLFIMNTNATLIDDGALELMAPPRRWSVFVSLDGPRRVHDRYRVNAAGEGSFDDVLRGLERLREAGIPFGLLAVFGPRTGRHLGETLATILELGPQKVQLSANYRAEWNEQAIADLRHGLAGAADVWMDHFRAGKLVLVDPFHTKILAHIKGGLPCPGRCLLGGSAFTVTPSGRLYPCGQMVGEDDGGLAMGDVDRGYDLAALQRMQAAKDRVEATCASCELRDRCQSQCGCRHVALTGRLGEITETLCEIETAYIDESDRIAETLVEEKCPAFVELFYQRDWSPAEGAEWSPLRRAPDDEPSE
ncbi:MAG: radical SAM protein [Deltaproteobacteria bacterium]|nr:radical SAM protein [Deltaproteobacteria bacterium]MBW2537184.1 radical SAM protein [Deltaproteobacteria bacterium]